MIAELYPYLILSGATTLAVTAWLLHQARRQTQRASELISLNESLAFDLPDFLRASWPGLSSGGFTGLSWQLNWFGTPIQESHGKTSENSLIKNFDVGDITLNLQLYTPKHGWERRYFSHTLAEKFFLLLQMDMWIKVGSVRTTFEQTARMSVFLQHDIKNMLQLTNLATDQLMSPLPGQEVRLLGMLQRSLPALRERADRILKRLIQSSDMQVNTRSKAVSLDVEEFVSNALDLHGLPAKIEGPTCSVTIAPDSFQSILDNLMGNYVQQMQSGRSRSMPQIIVSWRSVDGLQHANQTSATQTSEFLDSGFVDRAFIDNHFVAITIYDKHGLPCVRPERLFEPFWSDHGDGRGIGLYQSRQLAEQWGGAIHIQTPADGPLVFELVLPKYS